MNQLVRLVKHKNRGAFRVEQILCVDLGPLEESNQIHLPNVEVRNRREEEFEVNVVLADGVGEIGAGFAVHELLLQLFGPFLEVFF